METSCFSDPPVRARHGLVEATAEVLIQNPRAVVKIDCAEFQHSHEIAKLIGSPPGYLGHRETHPLLSQEVINQHHTETVKISFILFDEIEKASDALWNLLLGILDKATLTLGDNRKVDFSQAMIFMTSNIGAGEMASLISPKLGFQAPVAERGLGSRRQTECQALEERSRGRSPQVHAGVHEPHRQSGGVQAAGSIRVATNPESRTGRSPTTRLPSADGQAFHLPNHRRRTAVSCWAKVPT